MTDTDRLRRELREELEAAATPKQVNDIRARYLGKRDGLISRLIRDTDFSALDENDRRVIGQSITELKSEAQDAINETRQRVERAAANEQRKGLVDLTLPGSDSRIGSLNPVVTTQMFLEDIFRGLGFRVEQGFEVESDEYNFDALNIPQDHPARDMHDTFWLDNGLLMRTHTSASQVRALREYGTPLRAIFPGRCFRYEETDASHETAFYQCEGLVVDKGVTVASLLGVMKTLLAEIFDREVTIRLRPGYFPFVEPGFELDLNCVLCAGRGCRVCKKTGWVELMPCGMVHPNVLAAGGIDSEVFSGFAFGLGLTRLAMMKYIIPDIRLIDSGDLRFYRQFAADV